MPSNTNINPKAHLHLRNFRETKQVIGHVEEQLLLSGVDGILMDLGMSSMQVNCWTLHNDKIITFFFNLTCGVIATQTSETFSLVLYMLVCTTVCPCFIPFGKLPWAGVAHWLCCNCRSMMLKEGSACLTVGHWICEWILRYDHELFHSFGWYQ